MKAQILKHTGLTEKQFYAKYKTADDFFNSKEGKAFKKAQGGGTFGFKKPGIPQTDYGQPQTMPFNNDYAGIPTPQQLPTSPDQQEMYDAARYLKGAGPNQDEMIAANQQIIGGAPPSGKKSSAISKFGPQDAINIGSGLFGAGQALKGEFDTLKNKRMWHNVTDTQVAASKTRPEEYDRMYSRPEDYVRTGETQKKTFGVGSNPIGQNGSMISNQFMQGNPGEIQNTFDPYDIYTDEGYEPLNESVLKQYQMGGQMASALANPANSFIGSQMNHNAGYQFGDVLGKGAQFIPGIGPIASAVASPLLGLTLGQIDKSFGPAGKIAKEQSAIDRNVMGMGLSNQIAGSRNTAVTQNGGFMTARNWNPQMISHYGKYSMKELMKPDPMMNTLQGGGELKTHWGGYAEPMSYNPYLPEGGETVMFRGNSHRESDGKGNTGIGVTYGDNPVEVERGEPAMKLQSGGGTDMVVFGDVPIGKMGVSLLGDPSAKNKKFKNYIADLSKQEAKHTKMLDKNTQALNDLKVHDPFGKLELASYQANIDGSNMSLKAIADKKQKAGFLQNAINETRDELSEHFGKTVSAPALGKGKFEWDRDAVTRNAKYGASLKKYADGGKARKFKSRKEAENAGFIYDEKTKTYRKPKGEATKTTSQTKAAQALGYVPKGQKRKSSGTWGNVTPEQVNQLMANNPWYDWTGFDPNRKNDVLKFQQEFNNKAIEIGSPARLHQDDALGEQTATAKLDLNAFDTITDPGNDVAVVEDPSEPLEDEKANWWNVLGAALPYVRPSNAGVLDTNQLMGEMYGLSNNQVEPVQAIGYQPELDIPQYYSMQDQRNAITGQSRAAQRMAGYNPAAQAAIAASAYDPINQINAEEFRVNQAEQAGVYDRNRATMNQAKQVNAALFDQQAQRQSQARSNTKAITQAALSSIADKYQKNALENKTLQTYENLYNYRYGPGMRAYNVNAPFQPNMPTVYHEGEDYAANAASSNLTPVYDKEGNFQGYKEPKVAKKETKSKEAVSRNGSIVSALKRM